VILALVADRYGTQMTYAVMFPEAELDRLIRQPFAVPPLVARAAPLTGTLMSRALPSSGDDPPPPTALWVDAALF
jgi:hypothetical protein